MDRGKDHILFPGDCPNEAMVPDAIPLIIRRLSLQTPEQKVSENKDNCEGNHDNHDCFRKALRFFTEQFPVIEKRAGRRQQSEQK